MRLYWNATKNGEMWTNWNISGVRAKKAYQTKDKNVCIWTRMLEDIDLLWLHNTVDEGIALWGTEKHLAGGGKHALLVEIDGGGKPCMVKFQN